MRAAELRTKLRSWLPPALEPVATRLFGVTSFSGDFSSWQEAHERSRGYDDEKILLRVQEAALAVRRGDAAYEQDSVLFPVRSYNWPLLAELLGLTLRNGGRLHVLDFGGSLGSVYFRHLPFWRRSGAAIRWSVVEQEHFVRYGREALQDDTLRFFPTIEACITYDRPDVLLASGVVQYLDDPYRWLEALPGHDIDCLIFDRTPFTRTNRDRLCIQRVGARIYETSFPAWHFSRSRFMEALGRYRLLEDWTCPERYNIPGTVEGFALERA